MIDIVKITVTVSNNSSDEKIVSFMYSPKESVDSSIDTVKKLVASRNDPTSDVYIEGVKWGMKIETEPVTDSTIIEGASLSTLRILLDNK